LLDPLFVVDAARVESGAPAFKERSRTIGLERFDGRGLRRSCGVDGSSWTSGAGEIERGRGGEPADRQPAITLAHAECGQPTRQAIFSLPVHPASFAWSWFFVAGIGLR
jgi:hypothetical protein